MSSETRFQNSPDLARREAASTASACWGAAFDYETGHDQITLTEPPGTLREHSNASEGHERRALPSTRHRPTIRCGITLGLRAPQRPALQLPPRRTTKTVKKATISRAEGGQLQAPVGRYSKSTMVVKIFQKVYTSQVREPAIDKRDSHVDT